MLLRFGVFQEDKSLPRGNGQVHNTLLHLSGWEPEDDSQGSVSVRFSQMDNLNYGIKKKKKKLFFCEPL